MSDSLHPYGLYVACQAPLSMGFSRQEYWTGFPCPPPGDLPNPGIEPRSLMSPALVGRFFTTSPTWEAQNSSAAAAKSLQSCLTLCIPMDSSPPGSPVPGILLWGSSQPRDRTRVSRITRGFFTSWATRRA